MSKLTKLEKAINEQAANLDPAQREFVLEQFNIYKWNADKIAELEGILEDGELETNEETKLFKQRHQLVAEQGQLFSHIMRWIKGTASESSPLDEFMR